MTQQEVKKFEYKKGEHIFICGKTGTGKSFGLIKLIQNHIKDDFIIIDIKQEDFNKLGCKVVKNYSQFVKALLAGNSKILVQDDNMTIEKLDKYAKFLYEKFKNFTLIVDELHELCTKHKIAPYMKKILHIGRSKGKGFVGASQRTADIHNSVMSQTIHKFSFYLGLLSDRKRMEEELDLSTTDLSFENLPEYHFLYKYDKGKNPVIVSKF